MNSELQITNAQVRADAANNRKIKERDIQFKKNINQITTQLKNFPTYKLTQKNMINLITYYHTLKTLKLNIYIKIHQLFMRKDMSR